MLPTHDVDFCCTAAYFTSDCPEIDWSAVFPMHAAVPESGQVGMNPRVGAVQQSSLHLWNGDGGLHLLPSDFRIRSMDSHTLWRFWLRGAPADGVQPYRLLKAHMLPPSAQLQNQKQQLSRMLHVGSFLQANSGAMLGQLRDATALELTSFFDTAWAYLLVQYPAAKKSHSVGTLYKIMHE